MLSNHLKRNNSFCNVARLNKSVAILAFSKQVYLVGQRIMQNLKAFSCVPDFDFIV